MNRIKLMIIGLVISLSVSAQKDSIVYKADSIDVMSVKDVLTTLKYLEDKITKKQYDEAVGYFQLLLQVVDSKRKTIIKHK